VTDTRSGHLPNFGRSFNIRQKLQEFLLSWSILRIQVSSVRYVDTRIEKTGKHEMDFPVFPVITLNQQTLTLQKILHFGLPPTSLW